MTKGDLSGITAFGRPVKPLALGLALIMLSYAVFNTFGLGVLSGNWFGYVLALTAGVSFTTLTLGWWMRSQRLAELGLLASTATFILRCSFVLLVSGWQEERVYLNLSMVIISGGAYLLERWDEN